MFKTTVLLMLSSALLASGMGWAQPGDLRDPTRPLSYRAGGASVELELNSILVGGERKLAVINGQQLRENDVLSNSGGIRLRRIEPQAVVLEKGDKVWRLRLAGSAVRRAAPTEN